MALIATAFAFPTRGHAEGGVGPDGLPPAEQCQVAIAATERAQEIPPHLLAALGRVESGRRDPATGRLAPWPWTIDVGGQGAFFPTKQLAVDAVRQLQANGIAPIDVGCLQIDLSFHPHAFTSLEQAFDPGHNVAYGARFLRVLYGQTGDWGAAVGRYHSMTPALAQDYRQKVMATWSGGAIENARASSLHALARAWAATLDTPSERVAKPLWPEPASITRTVGYAPRGRKEAACRGQGWHICRAVLPPLRWQAALDIC